MDTNPDLSTPSFRQKIFIESIGGVIIAFVLIFFFIHSGFTLKYPIGGNFYGDFLGNVYEKAGVQVDCGGFFAIGCHTEYSYLRLPDVHVWSFKDISGLCGKSSNHIYCGHEIIQGADVVSFEKLQGGYLRDKNNLYLESQYGADTDNSFSLLLKHDDASGKDASFNTNSVTVFPNCNLLSDGEGVYVTNLGTMQSSLDSGDPFGLQSPNDIGTKISTVILRLQKIPNADPTTFTVTKVTHDAGNNPYCVASDKNSYYKIAWVGDGNASGVNGWRVSTTSDSEGGIDYSVYSAEHLSYDIGTNAVYSHGNLIPGASTSTFSYIAYSYSKDAKHVFFFLSTVAGADPNTFVVIGIERDPEQKGVYVSYAKDKLTVYANGQEITGADPNTFSLLENGYAKDAVHVYYKQNVIEGANPNTFVVPKS